MWICYTYYMNKELPKENFGLPRVSYDPMETINMEGRMFRGMVDPTRERSLFVRIMTILICLFVFLLPGLFILSYFIYTIIQLETSNVSDMSEYISSGAGLIILASMSLLFIGVGFAGIKANIKK